MKSPHPHHEEAIPMDAVTIEPLNTTYFVTGSPPGKDWAIQEDVDLDLACNFHLWPLGEDRPEVVLCSSTSDPKHYKVFNHSREIDPAEFQPTGKNFGGVYSRTSWQRFLKMLPADLAIQAIPDDDPPGAMDEAIRGIREAR
jgi:hypothetical protein